MYGLKKTKVYHHEDRLFVLRSAVSHLCDLLPKDKEEQPGLFIAATSLIEKLDREIKRVEKRMKNENKTS